MLFLSATSEGIGWDFTWKQFGRVGRRPIAPRRTPGSKTRPPKLHDFDRTCEQPSSPPLDRPQLTQGMNRFMNRQGIMTHRWIFANNFSRRKRATSSLRVTRPRVVLRVRAWHGRRAIPNNCRRSTQRWCPQAFGTRLLFPRPIRAGDRKKLTDLSPLRYKRWGGDPRHADFAT